MPRKSSPATIQDPSDLKKPSLRISHIVYGRQSKGNRVQYLLDPKGEGSQSAIPEEVVLHRWRHRKFEGFTFSGARLSPSIWRALPTALDGGPSKWVKLSEMEIQQEVERWRVSTKRQFESLPSSNTLRALIQVCGAERLKKLIARHNDPARSKRFGTPDLFLFAVENASGRTVIYRFVEVKKPDERIKPDQREEIAYLQSLELQARVLRLEERCSPTHQTI